MRMATSPSEEALEAADDFVEGSSLVNAPSADWFSDIGNDTGPFATLVHEYEVISKAIGERLNTLVADKEALIRVHCPE